MKSIEEIFLIALNKLLENAKRGTKSRLAEYANTTRQRINHLLASTSSVDERTRRLIAKYFGYEYDEFLRMGEAILKGKEYEEPEEYLTADELRERGFITVPFSDDMKLAAGSGGQIRTTYNADESNIIVHGPSLRRTNNKGLHAFRVGGDSMEPLIAENSIVLADIDDNNIKKMKDDKIYVLCWDLIDGECAVKRLKWAMPGELIAIESTNNAANPTIYKKPNEITLVGRVIWSWREH